MATTRGNSPGTESAAEPAPAATRMPAAPAAPAGSRVPGPPAHPARNGAVLPAVQGLVAEMGERLGKRARFYSRVDEEELPEAYRPMLREVLSQLARNSLVHGLEPPQERASRGKPEVGTLQLALRRHESHGRLELIFQDDGTGLDLEKIRDRALSRGLWVDDERQLPMLIFESGFSTAETTTLDAGRGVGMDMVKTRVEELGGTILPHSRPGVFCAFQILLPLEPPESPPARQGSPPEAP